MFRIILGVIAIGAVLDFGVGSSKLESEQNQRNAPNYVEIIHVQNISRENSISLPISGTLTLPGRSLKLPYYGFREKRDVEDVERKCYTLINEVLVMNTAPTAIKMFIELFEHCGSKNSPRKLHHGEGYILLLAQEHPTDTGLKDHIIFFADLKGKQFQPTASNQYFFTIGNEDSNENKFNMLFSEGENVFSKQPQHAGAIPSESDKPITILLLKFPVGKDRLSIQKLKLQQGKDGLGKPDSTKFEKTIITDDITLIIKNNLVDLFIYGTKCSNENLQFYKSVKSDFPDSCDEHIFSSQLVRPAVTTTSHTSYSRCSKSNKPFLPSSFRSSTPTPGKENICGAVELTYPYSFRGMPLQSTTMKVLLNCLYAVKVAATDPSIFEGTPYDVVTKLHGVSSHTLTRTSKREKEQALLTPGKTRKGTKRVIISIDNFDREWITRKIIKSYRDGLAAEAKQLYKDFMSYKNEPTTTASQTSTPAQTATASQTSTPTQTATASQTSTPTQTVTASQTSTPAKTVTASQTSTPAQISTPAQTATASQTSTPAKTVTASQTSTPAQTATASQTSTPAQTATASQTSTPAQTPTGSIQPGNTERTTQAQIVANSNISIKKPTFRCSYTTFRRLLILMGYSYGKIDNRAAVMQRPELIKWRGMHLRALKLNDEQPQPKKLVYLDETWIDPNVRLAKGWAPDKCSSPREMAAYSFFKNKIGRGPRLIVFAAVMEDEIIPQSIHVYKIHKTKTADDYHQNVDAKAFMSWMKTLSTELKRRGGEYIFVMDNASYHSQKAIPKKSEKKAVLYKWLEDNKERSGLTFELKTEKQMRKWELEDLMDLVSAQPQMQKYIYTLDQMLEKDGHEVRRLPPYHCHLNPIELVWGVIKRKIASQNTAQNLDTIMAMAKEELKNYDKVALKNQFQHVKRLREELWQDDGLFETVVENSVRIDLSEDDFEDDEGESEDINELQDGIPYGDDVWELVDDADLSSDVFENEREIGQAMRPPPAKRARCGERGNPTTLNFENA